MSAFLVGYETIDRILSWMICRKKMDEKTAHVFGQEMLNMNAEAVNQRYDEGNVMLGYKFRFRHASIFQALKSLQCWLYQCSEGNVPDRESYKKFRELESEIMDEIISDMKEYEQAEWG
jgi:hypothetical protein